MALTVKRIARFLSKPGRYSDGGGLYLQIPTAGKLKPREKRGSWLLRYERNGKAHWFGLGQVKDFNLDEARERARKARQQLHDGIDPLSARQAERAAQALADARKLTFEQAANDYFNGHEKKWNNAKHKAQFLNTLRDYVFPTIGKFPVAAIDIPLVLKCIEPNWQTKAITMSRVRGRIENVLDWAKAKGYRAGDNPAAWKVLGKILAAPKSIAKSVHHPALPYADMPAFLIELRKREGVSARALEFLILTAARTGEVFAAKWDEFDLTNATWTIPAGRMKAKKEHRVPLASAVIELLRKLPHEKGNPFVFIGSTNGNSLSASAMVVLLNKRMGRKDITVHGFRSTFRDWAAEETTAYPNHVVEMALAHAVGNAVEKAYRRGDLFDKRKRLMADWARFCVTPVKATDDKVVPMHGRR